MKTHLKLSLVAGLLLTSVAQAQQVISYFAQIPQTTTNWTQTLQLPGFDSNLGSLTQVTLSYEGNIWQSVFAENKNHSSAYYHLSNTASLSLAKLAGPTLIAANPFVFNRSGSLTAFDGLADYSGTSGVTFNNKVTISGVYQDANISSYQDVSLVAFTATALGDNNLILCRYLNDGALTTAAASVRVEYGFAAIPEPSTYAAIMGVSALALVAIRRRRGLVAQP